MNKVPCGGFELGESLIMKDGKLDVAEGAGGGGDEIIIEVSLSKSIKSNPNGVCEINEENYLKLFEAFSSDRLDKVKFLFRGVH